MDKQAQYLDIAVVMCFMMVAILAGACFSAVQLNSPAPAWQAFDFDVQGD